VQCAKICFDKLLSSKGYTEQNSTPDEHAHICHIFHRTSCERRSRDVTGCGERDADSCGERDADSCGERDADSCGEREVEGCDASAACTVNRHEADCPRAEARLFAICDMRYSTLVHGRGRPLRAK
jgi:hypothetical protein